MTPAYLWICAESVQYRDWTSVSHYGAAVQQLSTEMTEQSIAFKVEQLFLQMAPYCLAYTF